MNFEATSGVKVAEPKDQVKLRDHNGKKKKTRNELKSRISMPAELRNGVLPRSAQQPVADGNHLQFKPLQRTTAYKPTWFSMHALDRPLDKSNTSPSNLSPYNNAGSATHQSRNEQRLSMLCRGYGKIESYTKLEKLGEGKTEPDLNSPCIPSDLGTYATVYKGTTNLLSGFVALKEIRLEQEEGRSRAESLQLIHLRTVHV